MRTGDLATSPIGSLSAFFYDIRFNCVFQSLFLRSAAEVLARGRARWSLKKERATRDAASFVRSRENSRSARAPFAANAVRKHQQIAGRSLFTPALDQSLPSSARFLDAPTRIHPRSLTIRDRPETW